MGLERSDDEKYISYLKRIVGLKRDGKISYDEMGDCLLGVNNVYSSDNIRKAYYILDKIVDNIDDNVVLTDEELFRELEVKKRELERERIKFRDERNAWNKQNYIDARVEQKLDYLEERLGSQAKVNFNIKNDVEINSDNDMLVMLTDLHIGQTFDSAFGKYDTDIAKDRLENYLNEIIKIKKLHNSQNCYVSIQGDLISGSIHKSLAISNRENVIEQIKIASELISSFVFELSKHFSQIYSVSVSGNHTRMDKKDDALHNERLDDLIGWYVKQSLKYVNNFTMFDNIDTGIGEIEIRNKKYVAVHGDYDGFSKVGVSNLSFALGYIPYAVLYGHLHTPSFTDVNGVKIVRGGSLAGCGDDYTIEKRLVGNPSQTICICTEKGILANYPIEL